MPGRDSDQVEGAALGAAPSVEEIVVSALLDGYGWRMYYDTDLWGKKITYLVRDGARCSDLVGKHQP